MLETIRLTLAVTLCVLLPVQSGATAVVLCMPACGHWTVGVEGAHHHCACRVPERTTPSCCDAGCSHAPAASEDSTHGTVDSGRCPCDCDDLPLPKHDDGVSPDRGADARELTGSPLALAAACELLARDLQPTARTPATRGPPAAPPLTIRTTVLHL